MRQDTGTLDRPQGCPQDQRKWCMALTSPPTSQRPARPRTPNPRGLVVLPCRICNLTYTPLGSWLFLDMSKPSLQVGWSHNKLLYFFTANFCLCISFSQCAQTDRLKYWSLIINSKWNLQPPLSSHYRRKILQSPLHSPGRPWRSALPNLQPRFPPSVLALDSSLGHSFLLATPRMSQASFCLSVCGFKPLGCFFFSLWIFTQFNLSAVPSLSSKTSCLIITVAIGAGDT